MEYRPQTAVWEITMGCNMRCGHCGSSCEEKLQDEMTTQEAFTLIDEIAELGLKWITLSGGEPLTRQDLPQLIERLKTRGVSVNIITNAWTLDRNMAQTLKNSGVATVAISIDGLKETHDSIRKAGSFERNEKAFGYLKEAGITSGAVTTISKPNLVELSELCEKLINWGVQSWQLQIGLPMGNLKEKPEWVIEPEQVDDIIDFCYKTALARKIKIFPADCIGYFTEKEMQVRRISYSSNQIPMWDGCNAGIRGFGVLHNGDILGCTSIRDRRYVEGNVKKTRLIDIWNNPNAFAWRRKITKGDLSDDCSICNYGSRCLGGCPNTRITMKGNINSENQYCAYNLALKKSRSELSAKSDVGELIQSARKNMQSEDFQYVALVCERILELDRNHAEAVDIKGFAEYMCGNYKKSEMANREALEINSQNFYAMKGLGLALHKQGRSDEGLAFLELAAKITSYSNSDIMNDLTIVKREILMAAH